ncbi:MAG: hypothetical protein J7L78_02555 [Dehalococcoidales bacterium]|nr:hypothetical protein [Dehalococcoidales bacterium]
MSSRHGWMLLSTPQVNEASGGLELPMVTALAVAGLPVVVVNPRQVRDSAKATGKLCQGVNYL